MLVCFETRPLWDVFAVLNISTTQAVAHVTDITYVGLGKGGHTAELDMTQTLAMYGPVTVAINMPPDFHLYTGGIYSSRDCSKVKPDTHSLADYFGASPALSVDSCMG